MKGRRITLRGALRAVATIVVIAAAAAVWHFLPVATQIFAPFDVHGTSGHPTNGRGIAATVHGARVSSDVVERSTGAKQTPVHAIGRWVVVDATVQALRNWVLPKADLVVAGNTYTPAERFSLYNVNGLLDPGIPQRGMWVFDVAADLLDANASTPFIVRIWVGDGRLDSRLVVAVDKRDVTGQNVVRLARPQVGA